MCIRDSENADPDLQAMGFNPLLTTRPNGPSEAEATARYRTTAPDSSYATVMAVESRAVAEELSQEVERDLSEQGLIVSQGSNEPQIVVYDTQGLKAGVQRKMTMRLYN